MTDIFKALESEKWQKPQYSLVDWSGSSYTLAVSFKLAATSVTSKKSPNVYKSCPKMISLAKLKILTPSQKLSKYVGDLGKLIVAKGFKKFPKVQ